MSFCISFQLIMMKLLRRLQVIILVNSKTFYLSIFFWLCRISQNAPLPSPYPCSSLGFHVFAFSPALFPGFSFYSLFPLFFSPPSLLPSPLLSPEESLVIQVQPSTVFLTSVPSFSEQACPLCLFCPLWAPIPCFQWPVDFLFLYFSQVISVARIEFIIAFGVKQS